MSRLIFKYVKCKYYEFKKEKKVETINLVDFRAIHSQLHHDNFILPDEELHQ